MEPPRCSETSDTNPPVTRRSIPEKLEAGFIGMLKNVAQNAIKMRRWGYIYFLGIYLCRYKEGSNWEHTNDATANRNKSQCSQKFAKCIK